MPIDGFMPINTFSTLAIVGLVKINNVHVPVICSRGISKPARTLIIKQEHCIRDGGPPARPPSELPPPGDLCLHVSLQPERLGHGRVGSVYSTTVDGSSEFSLPPLVMKVAARHRSENLAREAWFYEEMECIQGASIARCYGFFTAEIDPNSEVLDWEDSDKNHDPDEIVDFLDEDNEGEGGEEDNNSPDMAWSVPKAWIKNNFIVTQGLWPDIKVRNPTPDTKDITEEGSRKQSNHPVNLPELNRDEKILVSVLVLERLGDLMPMFVSLEAIKPDIHEIYSDLGRFGIEQIDIRWRNILAAPAAHDSLICPYHGHKHQWRVIDFDRARKSNFKCTEIDNAQEAFLRRIFRGLAEGYIIEPWD